MKMTDEIMDKYEALQEYLRKLGRIIVSFSGGVDSTFLLKTAHDVLGDNVLAVTADAAVVPAREMAEAERFCRDTGIRHEIFSFRELDIKEFVENRTDRCYYCKRQLLEKVKEIASLNGFVHITEGSNMDDTGDYRPGSRAVREAGILSPLQEAGLYKEEIRALSEMLGLPTWDKPSFACLASRFPYGETITRGKLRMIEKAEQFLIDRGFRQMRVRYHGDIARLELLPEDMDRMTDEHLRREITEYIKRLGFTYVAMDLTGYRTGSMNAGIDKDVK